MSKENLIIAAVVIGIGLLVFLVYYFNPKTVLLRQLAKLPFKSIGAFKLNQRIKIKGKALHANTPLIAPLSKRKCVFYSIKIEQQKSSGKSSHWKTIVNDTQFQDFFIEKNGNLVLVKPSKNPKNYYCYLVKDKHTKSGTFNNPTPEFEALLKTYGIKSTGFLGFNKPLKYSEGIIEIGEEIVVGGTANWLKLNEPIPEYPYSKIATLQGSTSQKLLITDLPKAFKVDKTKL